MVTFTATFKCDQKLSFWGSAIPSTTADSKASTSFLFTATYKRAEDGQSQETGLRSDMIPTMSECRRITHAGSQYVSEHVAVKALNRVLTYLALCKKIEASEKDIHKVYGRRNSSRRGPPITSNSMWPSLNCLCGASIEGSH